MSAQLKDERKWVCDYCTYENWPASKRCVLCRAPKAPQLISDVAPDAGQENIYDLAGLSESKNFPDSSQASWATSSKWVCQACTYLNWSKATKCAQCLTSRTKVVPVLSKNQNQGLSVNVVALEPKTTDSKGAASTTPETSKTVNNEKNKNIATHCASGASSSSRASPGAPPTFVKWACKACTYENWPKSLKCIICHTAKNLSSPENVKDLNHKNSEAATVNIGEASSSGGTCCKPPAASSYQCLDDSTEGAEAACSYKMAEVSPRTCTGKDKSIVDKNNRTEIREVNRTTHTSPPLCNKSSSIDQLWLQACQGVVNGDYMAVEAYLAISSDVGRPLTNEECILLDRPSAFGPGDSLIHLAVRFQREDLLPVLLSTRDMAGKVKAKKRLFCHVSPDSASLIIREICLNIRQRKGDFPCYFLTDISTFFLPAEIELFPLRVKEQILSEIIDEHVQTELEVNELVINWSMELTSRLGSRLYALWNRTAGDCLLDSVLQASWGVFDRDNTIRRSLADSLSEGAKFFYPRWKETENRQAASMQYSLDENQWQQDWATLLGIASQPGSSLEQVHIFALSHILRRPIIVYGIKFVKSFRGENLGLARFQGVYLPLMWEPSFCWKCPIALGYTRGHFSALVAQEKEESPSPAGAVSAAFKDNGQDNEDDLFAFLPLMDCHRQILPIHFLPPAEIGKDECVLRRWMDCWVTDGGILVAKQKHVKRPLPVKQMVDAWLDRYQRLAHVFRSQNDGGNGKQTASKDVSSGEDSDEG